MKRFTEPGRNVVLALLLALAGGALSANRNEPSPPASAASPAQAIPAAPSISPCAPRVGRSRVRRRARKSRRLPTKPAIWAITGQPGRIVRGPTGSRGAGPQPITSGRQSAAWRAAANRYPQAVSLDDPMFTLHGYPHQRPRHG